MHGNELYKRVEPHGDSFYFLYYILGGGNGGIELETSCK